MNLKVLYVVNWPKEKPQEKMSTATDFQALSTKHREPELSFRTLSL